jgi:hypothetical protein
VQSRGCEEAERQTIISSRLGVVTMVPAARGEDSGSVGIGPLQGRESHGPMGRTTCPHCSDQHQENRDRERPSWRQRKRMNRKGTDGDGGWE